MRIEFGWPLEGKGIVSSDPLVGSNRTKPRRAGPLVGRVYDRHGARRLVVPRARIEPKNRKQVLADAFNADHEPGHALGRPDHRDRGGA